jgi:leucyl aminopeptidase
MHNIPILEAKTTLGKTVQATDVVAVYQDSAKKPVPPKGPYGLAVAKLRKSDAFAARQGSTEFVRFGGKGGVADALFVGLGTAEELTEEKARSAGGHAWQKLLAVKCKAVVVRADALFGAKGLDRDLTETRLARAFAEGLILGAYKFEKHKGKVTSEKQKDAKKATADHGPSRITFVTKDKVLQQQLNKELAEVHASALAIQVTRDWSNEPSNYGTPEYFASESKRLAKEYGLKCTILTEKDAEREKMGLFLAVGQGAEREGRIVVLEYNPPKKSENQKTIAFVGKGVTFDSGGISIKPSMRMEEMKHDMTGAATLMGAILLAAKTQVPNRIVAILAFTENMPDGNALQPGNVITSRAGKTVEIINTDAEGRLILADVLDYAHEFKPDVIIDAATLTGAVSIALGKYCCGILGNDDGLIAEIRRCGSATGERIWELPLFDDYFDDMRSETADMKNSCNDGYGGTIRGAIFLKQFIKKGQKWAHLDIAATAWGLNHLSYMPKRTASGLYVRALARFAAEFSGEKES